MKNKKRTIQLLLIIFFFASIFFGASGFSDTVFAQDAPSSAAAEAGVRNGDAVLEDDGYFTTGAKYLLYALLLILIKFVQVAASVFTWATQPGYISGDTGLLNLDSVYTLWKFIRDFFNLFFIFLLLFSAFATVFQIEQYGIKKNFFKIIAAAIAINFSFPLTRIIIDLGNVPMYFFAQGLTSLSGNGNALQGIPQAFFQSSGITEIGLLPDPGKTGTLVPLLTGVIFMFIFMITLFVLALLFVMRLLTLVVLLIFSPLGVAASIVPGLSKYGKDWWSSLLKNVFFGPAAMLMVVIALRFTLELNGGAANTGTTFTQGLGGTAPAANASSQSSIIAQGIFFIPIILMWMAMSAGSKFGIYGASEVMKRADKAAAWGKKAALGAAKYPVWTNATVRGARKGVAKRAYEGRLLGDKVKNITGGRLGGKAWKESGQNTEARIKGFIDKGKKGADLEKRKAEDKRINEKVKEFKEDYLSRADLEDKLLKGTQDEQKAAALSLAESKDGIKKKPEVLAKALQIFSNENDFEKFEKMLKAADDDAFEMKSEQFSSIIDNPKILAMYQKAKGVSTATEAREKLIIDFGKQIKRVGGDIDRLFEYETGKLFNTTDAAEKITRPEIEKLYKKHQLTMRDLSQQSTLIRNTDFQDFTKETFTASEANELAKFVVQNNKNADVRVAVEQIKDTVGKRGSTAESGRSASGEEARAKRAADTKAAATEEGRSKRER